MKKAILAAEKAGRDISGFGKYAKSCKDMDDIEKLHKVLNTAYDDAIGFILYPDDKFAKFAVLYLKNQADFIDLVTSVHKTADDWADVCNGLMTANKSDKAKVKAIDGIGSRRHSESRWSI